MTRDDDAPGLSDELKRMVQEFGARVQPLEELQHEVAGIRGRGEAAGGLVKVEALPGGGLTSLVIESRALRLGSEALAEAILEAVNQASGDATRAMSELVNGTTSPIFAEARRLLEERR
ncbi:YbaB/EbfC family nucleoid-associated protein [Actinoallomurus sp. CA-150999]|uniref:YbaB/EbfC family nucleoid-associated protein n=1 Tax=Actinoallomurus sp. CA-150999 TaxID=3239887 RepID=UPI003D8B3993